MKHSDYEERSHRVYRDTENGLLLGVCAGIARHFDFPVWLTRIAVLALGWFFPFSTIVAYIAAALLMPEHPLHYRGDGDERSFWQSRKHRS
ncbi:MAG TPA: PspC domain-containing protein [Rhodanobacteraceae bacterium]